MQPGTQLFQRRIPDAVFSCAEAVEHRRTVGGLLRVQTFRSAGIGNQCVMSGCEPQRGTTRATWEEVVSRRVQQTPTFGPLLQRMPHGPAQLLTRSVTCSVDGALGSQAVTGLNDLRLRSRCIVGCYGDVAHFAIVIRCSLSVEMQPRIRLRQDGMKPLARIGNMLAQ